MPDWIKISRGILKRDPLGASQVLERASMADLTDFFAESPSQPTAECLKFMNSTLATEILVHLKPEQAAEILIHLPMESTLLYLRPLKKTVLKEIRSHLPDNINRAIDIKLEFPPGTAGYIMNPNLLTVTDDLSVDTVVNLVKKYSNYIEHYIFVVERSDKLAGHIHTRQLFLHEKSITVGIIVKQFVETLAPWSTYTQIAKSPGWLEHHALPVVDKNGILLGAINYSYLLQQSSELNNDQIRNSDVPETIFQVMGQAAAAIVGFSTRTDGSSSHGPGRKNEKPG